MRIRPSESIRKYFNMGFDEQIMALLDENASIVTFDKGQLPIQAGEEGNAFYLILHGLVRGYYLDDDGHEVTKCFASENCFFGSECYRTKQGATFYVECLEACECIRLPYALVRELETLDARMEKYIQRLYLEEVARLEQRTRNLLLMDAGERYMDFCKQYPDLQKRVQLRYIASYIGIKPASMSRLRKKYKKI